jgi:hypothetical protein
MTNLIIINTATGATTFGDSELAGEITTLGKEQIEWAVDEFGRSDNEPWIVVPAEPLEWQIGGRR